MKGIEACLTGKIVQEVPAISKSANDNDMLKILAAVDGEDSLTVMLLVFGERAHILIEQKVSKFDRIYAFGKIRLSEWPDRATGEIRHGLTMMVDRIDLHGVERATREAVVARPKPPPRLMPPSGRKTSAEIHRNQPHPKPFE